MISPEASDEIFTSVSGRILPIALTLCVIVRFDTLSVDTGIVSSFGRNMKYPRMMTKMPSPINVRFRALCDFLAIMYSSNMIKDCPLQI